MADYSTYVSFTIPLRPDQQDWAINELQRDEADDEDACYVICEKNGGPAEFDLLVSDGIAMKAPPKSGDYVWISHDGGSVFVEALAGRLQNIMKHFDLSGTWGFQWSNDCSKPRTDAYGGGACAVSQTHIEWMNTYAWLREHGVETDGMSNVTDARLATMAVHAALMSKLPTEEGRQLGVALWDCIIRERELSNKPDAPREEEPSA